jgi:Lrp/AsnC family transcriptional regulator, regulator for asnA, asnC and gidA
MRYVIKAAPRVKKINNNVSTTSLLLSSGARKIDELDFRIMSLMTQGLTNKEIADRLKIPLSTIQRRTKKLIEGGMISMRAEVNLERMGVKKGMIHVYLRDGNIDQIARRVCTINTIDSVEIHIGNSDLIANMLYKDNKQLLQTIADIKKIESVDRILWSEQVYNIKSNNSII